MPEVWVPECPPDHRVLTKRQERWGAWRDGAPRSDAEARWIAIRGVIDTVTLAMRADGEIGGQVADLAALMAPFMDIGFAFELAAEDPEREWGPDPILNTPRAFKGFRRAPRAPQRRTGLPPAAADRERFVMMVGLAIELDRFLTAGSPGIGGIDPNRFADRWAELAEELSFDPFDEFVAQWNRLVTEIVQACNLKEFGQALRPFLRLGLLIVRLHVEVGAARDSVEARDALDRYHTAFRRAAIELEETGARDDRASPPSRRAGLHDEDRG